MKDRKRVFDKRNIDRLEGEVKNFIEANQTRFENEKKEEERKLRKNDKSSKRKKSKSKSKSRSKDRTTSTADTPVVTKSTKGASAVSQLGNEDSTVLGSNLGVATTETTMTAADARGVSLHYEDETPSVATTALPKVPHKNSGHRPKSTT